jgi:hypothetical protein
MMAHKKHTDDDEPTSAEMKAVGVIPGGNLLFAMLLKALRERGIPLVLAAFGKALFKQKLKTKAAAQALPDGSEVVKAAFHGLGVNARLSIIKESNRGPSPEPEPEPEPTP